MPNHRAIVKENSNESRNCKEKTGCWMRGAGCRGVVGLDTAVPFGDNTGRTGVTRLHGPAHRTITSNGVFSRKRNRAGFHNHTRKRSGGGRGTRLQSVPRNDTMNSVVSLTLYLCIGTVGGFLGSKLRIPAGALIGAMVSVIAFKTLMHKSWDIPKSYGLAIQIGMGVMVAASFTPGMFKDLGRLMIPVASSTVVLVAVGAVLAIIFHRMGFLDMKTSYIGTSPGALSVLVPLASETGTSPAIVVCFHFFRVVAIILTAPFVFKYLIK